MKTTGRFATLCALALASLPATGAAQAGQAPSQAAGAAHSRATVAPGKPGTAPAKRGPTQPDTRADTRVNARPAPGSSGDAPALWWHDGERRRELRIDPARVADFRAAPAGKSVSVRARTDAEKRAPALPAGLSPVFVDPGAPGQVRALPGGVIVTLKPPPAGNDDAAREAQARQQIDAAGVRPLRPIGPDARRWLVASPPGMPALELANRLRESGDFESAAPNWWQPRALK